MFFVFLLTACQPNSSTSNVSQTQNGVTLTITDVTYSENETIVTYITQVNSRWGLDVKAFPPQQALPNKPILFDGTGKQYNPTAYSGGLPQIDAETGGVKFENTVTFPPVDNKTISFQSGIEISEIPIIQPVSVSIYKHKVLDVWSTSQGITFNFSSFADIPVKVKLLSRNDSKMELEFTFERVTNDGLKLGCLSYYPDNQDMTSSERGCQWDEKQIVSRVRMDSPKDELSPILFHVTANVAFIEPFKVSWSTTNK
jgi:hypothetical protein